MKINVSQPDMRSRESCEPWQETMQFIEDTLKNSKL